MNSVIRRTLFAALAALLLVGMLAPAALASGRAGNGGRTIEFERYTAGSREWAVVTAYDWDGSTAWEYTTDVYDIAEVPRVGGVGVCNGLYYLVEDGTVIALDAEDGSIRWENSDFCGAPAEDASAFGKDGELYLSGYFGPDLFIVDARGNTVDRISSLSDEYMWPYELLYMADGLAITFESGPTGDNETLYVDADRYASSTAGAVWGETVGMALPANAVSSVTATSHLEEPQYGFSHTAGNLVDGTLSHAWVEGVSGQGEGESVTLWLSGTYLVSGFTINAGYQKSVTTYNNNSRPAVLEASFSDGTGVDITLRDYNGQQVVEFPYPVNTSSVTLTIRSVYPGTKYQDTVISEVALF